MIASKKWLLASLPWFAIAAGIVADGFIAEADFQAELAARSEESGQLEFGTLIPAIDLRLSAPLCAAGFVTIFGFWKLGMMVGIPAVGIAAYQFARWYASYAEMQQWINH